jgi:hypothetical protein
LASPDVEDTALMLDLQSPPQYDRYLFELGSLPRLFPAAGRHHAGDTDPGMAGVDAPGVSSIRFGLFPAAWRPWPAR